MNEEKIFWALAITVLGGMVLFLAFGSIVLPANAAQAPVLQAAAPSSAAAGAPGGQLAAVKGGVQEVVLSVQGANYYPNPIRVKKGVPVRLVADISSMPGCSKSIVIPEFGIRKTVSTGDNLMEFTPDKSGTFDFSCSMGMYRGKIVVEEADGSVAAYAGSAPAPSAGGHACGMGGGCGCGG